MLNKKDLAGETSMDGPSMSKYTHLTAQAASTAHMPAPASYTPNLPPGAPQVLQHGLGSSLSGNSAASLRLLAPPVPTSYPVPDMLSSPRHHKDAGMPNSPPSPGTSGFFSSPPPRGPSLLDLPPSHFSSWSPAQQNPYGTVPRSHHYVGSQSSLFSTPQYGRSLPRFNPKLRPAKSESSLIKYSSSPKLGRSWLKSMNVLGWGGGGGEVYVVHMHTLW